MNDFKKQLADKTDYIESVIKCYLPEEQGFQKTVIEAMNYSVMAGGKRLRPMLMMETAKLFCYNEEAIRPFMAAIELIHTYSLVHDDLPAMDDDEYRRGRKTTHVVYGEAMGILAGDGLLNYAFEIAAKAVVESKNPAAAAKALYILAEKAGIYGMIGGQTVDVLSTGHQVDKERLDYIYALKTSALMEASMMIGAVLCGASEAETDSISQVATKIGQAFQIQDDILDVSGNEKAMGKPIHSDQKNQKTTYVTLIGVENAKECVKDLSNSALEQLNVIGNQNAFLNELLYSLVNREH